MSSGHVSYEEAKGLKTAAIRLTGNTYAHRDWLRQRGGTFDRQTKTWTITLPGNTAGVQQTIGQAVTRGMRWDHA